MKWQKSSVKADFFFFQANIFRGGSNFWKDNIVFNDLMQHILHVTNLRTPSPTAILHEQKNKNKFVGVFVSFPLLAGQ